TVTGCTGTGCSFTSSTCTAGSAQATCTITWTPPANLCVGAACPDNGARQYWLKYSQCSGSCTPRAIQNWLGFHSNCLVHGSALNPNGIGNTDTAADCVGISTLGGSCVVDAADGSGCYDNDPTTNMNWFAAKDVPDGNLNTTVASGSSYSFKAPANTVTTFALRDYGTQTVIAPKVINTTQR